MQLPHAQTGARTAELVARHTQQLASSGGALLLRHSAREFEPGRHDLLNPLTEPGRELASRLGSQLPPELALRGYASPAERCLETAQLMLAGYGGESGRTRPMEGLGVFYVLDQMKMFRALQSAGGLRNFVTLWVAGEIAADILLPAHTAVTGLMNGLASRVLARSALVDRASAAPFDVCVSHDLTVQLLRSVLYSLLASDDSEVEFLDGLLLFVEAGEVHIAAHDYPARALTPLLKEAR